MSHTRVLLTGAGRGIGRATALALGRGGAHVALLARSSKELEQVAGEVRDLGGSASVFVVDLSCPEQVAPAIEAAVDALGGSLDLLINNAGIFNVAPIDGMDLAFWQRMLDVNLTAPMLVTQAALPALRLVSEPTIICVASIAAELGFPGNTAYCASKYGLKGFADALRADLAPLGIAVRTVYPRGTATTIFEGVEGDWDLTSMDTPEAVAAKILEAAQPGAPNDLRLAP